ncbi:MAG: hypothetical protein LBV38_03400 [Alistipes sp.]|jgi:hypothetical protein|nr:hypothetical protein [Alistipes sp.]
MKKRLLLLLAVGICFFTSCEKGIADINGTLWGLHNEYEEGWDDTVITFTATHATITTTFSSRGADIFTGTYTYDPPNVEIVGDTWLEDGVVYEFPFPLHHRGTVKGQVMTLSIMESPGLVSFGDYKKQ